VFGGLNRLLIVALVAGAFFVAPSAALADGCGGNASAVNVYKECLPSGGGGNGGGGGNSTHTGGQSGGQTGGQSGGSTAPVISHHTAKVLKHAGKDGRTLFALARRPSDRLASSPQESGTTTTPSAVGSAFDLGSGPTALLLALAAAAVLLLAASGVRGWRRSHRA
jgi:hypothetical protein